MKTQSPLHEPHDSGRTAPKALPDIIEAAKVPATTEHETSGPTLVTRLRAMWLAQKSDGSEGHASGVDPGLIILGVVVVAFAVIGYFGLL